MNININKTLVNEIKRYYLPRVPTMYGIQCIMCISNCYKCNKLINNSAHKGLVKHLTFGHDSNDDDDNYYKMTCFECDKIFRCECGSTIKQDRNEARCRRNIKKHNKTKKHIAYDETLLKIHQMYVIPANQGNFVHREPYNICLPPHYYWDMNDNQERKGIYYNNDAQPINRYNFMETVFEIAIGVYTEV